MKRIEILRNFLEYLLIIVSIASLSLCATPLMSVYSGGTEGCTLTVRGFNLMEFSALGCIPWLAIFLIPFIALGKQWQNVKQIEWLILFVFNAVCYNHSVIVAREWLTSVGDSVISYYTGLYIYPLVFICLFVITALYGIVLKMARK